MKKIIYTFIVFFICISCQEMQILEKQREQERKEKTEKKFKQSFVYKNFHGKHKMIPIAKNQKGKGIYFYFSEDKKNIEFYWQLKDKKQFILSKIGKDQFCLKIDSVYSEPRVSFEMKKDILNYYEDSISDLYSENPNNFFIGFNFDKAIFYCDTNNYPKVLSEFIKNKDKNQVK